MITQYIYSISINKQNETIRFLKSFDSFIEVEGKVLKKANSTSSVIRGDDSETITLIEICTKENFAEMYNEWKRITTLYKLSMEYVKDGWVYILAYKQLHSGIDYKYNQIIVHNEIPKQRPSSIVEKDLRLRKAEPKDYGCGETSESSEKQSIEELLIKQEWLQRWYSRFLYLSHNYANCICGVLDFYTAKDLFLQAFVLTIADIHKTNGDEIPEILNHLSIYPAQSGTTVPIVTTVGRTPINPNSQQYEIYVAPTFEGRARELSPNNTFYSRETSKEITNLYWAAIPHYSKLYPTP